MSVQLYDPKQVLLSVNDIPLGGYADGTFVSVEYDEDHYTKHVGADGNVTRIVNNNRTGSITLTLSGASNSNAILSALRNIDQAANANGTPGLVKVNLKDTRSEVDPAPPAGVAEGFPSEVTNTQILSAEGWVKTSPSVDFAKELSDREWVLDLATIDFFIAGSLTQTVSA